MLHICCIDRKPFFISILHDILSIGNNTKHVVGNRKSNDLYSRNVQFSSLPIRQVCFCFCDRQNTKVVEIFLRSCFCKIHGTKSSEISGCYC
jgi:hypothetical protein